MFKLIPLHLFIKASKSLYNFVGIAQRMVWNKLWQSNICRCCNSTIENNIDYVLYYKNKRLVELRHKLALEFEEFLFNRPLADYIVLDILFQVITGPVNAPLATRELLKWTLQK